MALPIRKCITLIGKVCIIALLIILLFSLLNIFEVPVIKHLRRRQVVIQSFNYAISPNHICDGETQIFIAIVSSPEDGFNRQTIRDTWASYSGWRKARVRLAFFIGSRPEQDRSKLVAESKEYGDIVVDDSFYDSYHNLTRKVLAAMNWAGRHCSMAEFFFKADTRVFVNPVNLIGTARHYDRSKAGKDFILGRLNKGVTPVRDQHNKRYISKEDYPYDKFPDYLDRESYLMRMKTARRMVEMVGRVPVPIGSPLEEVYITGILPLLMNLPLISSSNVNVPPNKASVHTISCSHVNSKLMKQLWSGINKDGL